MIIHKSLRKELEDYVNKTHAKWEIVEQDYVLSWVLYGISQIDSLNEHLIFKGGTALKKCYFGNYRFSQDLDFSIRNNCPKGEELFQLLLQAMDVATDRLNDLGHNVRFKCERYLEKQPHPENQEAFTVKASLPWHRSAHTNVMIEITTQEKVLLEPVKKQIIHDYNGPFDATINVYCLEEIIAEKIRALLQFSKKLHERGWGRSRVRDYYDIWRILTTYRNQIDTSTLPNLIQRKCESKGIVFNSFDDIFNDKLITNLDKEWMPWLEAVVIDKPEKDLVISDLRRIFEEI